jgi:pyruvate-formate lyase-activating enzyme
MGKRNKELCLAYADVSGRVWDYPGESPAFRTGNRFVRIGPEDLIELPDGSVLFSLPGRQPVSCNSGVSGFRRIEASPFGDEITAVSAFPASSYLRTYLPAYIPTNNAPVLPMWAYTGVAVIDGGFVIPALRIDEDVRSDPAIHENDRELKAAIASLEDRYPENRLIKQLSKCASFYRCLCSRNFFLGRYEAPVPTTPACNAACAGCLSFQKSGSPFPASQDRLGFEPSAEEIAEVILRHFTASGGEVASFGQGCEGEPLLRASELAEAIRLVREKTGKGTINLNTNGSIPPGLQELVRAGLDSVRISLNSPTREYYERYYRPSGYRFDDVLRSIDTALSAGIFVSINLFFLPGFTDMETEAEGLISFLRRFPVHMLQTRNLNIDPDFYFERIGFRESGPVGILNLLNLIKKEFPAMRLGYYNPHVKK